jgi:hypothetical protein
MSKSDNTNNSDAYTMADFEAEWGDHLWDEHGFYIGKGDEIQPIRKAEHDVREEEILPYLLHRIEMEE